MVWDRIPVETRFSACPDWPWGPPSLLYNGYRVFPGGKVWPAHTADHSPPSNAAVVEEYSYTTTHPLGHTRPIMGSFYLYLFFTNSRRNITQIMCFIRKYEMEQVTPSKCGIFCVFLILLKTIKTARISITLILLSSLSICLHFLIQRLKTGIMWKHFFLWLL